GTTSSPVWPMTLTLVPSHGARFNSDGMLRCDCGGRAPISAPGGRGPEPRDAACPAAENTISPPVGAKRGACRYPQVSCVLKNGRAFEPSTFALQRPSG